MIYAFSTYYNSSVTYMFFTMNLSIVTLVRIASLAESIQLSKRQENNLLLCPAIQLSLKYERKGDFDFDWKAQLYFIEVSNFYSFAFFQIYTFFYFSRCCHYKFRLFQKLLGTLLLKVSCDSLLRLQTSYSHFTNNFFLMLFQKIS